MNYVKILISTAAALLIAWEIVLAYLHKPDLLKKYRDVFLIFLTAFALVSWFDFFKFPYGCYEHVWDIYHNYIGAKYYKEFGYDGLYKCTLAADVEDDYARKLLSRKIRNLETNLLENITPEMADPTACKNKFSEERWANFKLDVAWFRNQYNPDDWTTLQQDFGYNSTPVWGVLGTVLANSGRTTDRQIHLLSLLDFFLAILMFGFVCYTFGWRVMCFSIIFWGANSFAPYDTTGGSFLRFDWIATLIIGICLARFGKMFASGFLIGYSALLRIFPVAVIFAMLMKIVVEIIQKKKCFVSREHKKFIFGCGAAFVVLLPLSILTAGKSDVWADFANNSRTHLNTPITNFMGLKTVLSFSAGSRLKSLRDDNLTDPLEKWKQTIRDNFQKRKHIFYAIVVAYLFFFAWFLKNQDDWVAATIGLTLIPVLFEITSYYYIFLIAFALLYEKNKLVGAGLFALSVLSLLIPMKLGWGDEQYTVTSAVVLFFVVIAVTLVGLGKGRGGSPKELPDAGRATR